MRQATLLLTLACLVLITSCTPSTQNGLTIEAVNDSTFSYRIKGREGKITLTRDSIFRVCHFIGDSLADTWKLKDPVYRFDCGDLTGDSLPEITVGVVRSTRYRPEPDKRLFIFKLWKGRLIRPLWMGSRLGLPLEDFRVERDSVPHMIHTWERQPDGTIVQAIYRQKGFGLRFVNYLN